MKLHSLAAAAALLLATSIFAAPIATLSNDVNGIFADDLGFAAGLFKGSLTFALTPVSGSVTFYSALLDGTGYSFAGVQGQPATFTATVDGSQPFDLTVLGYAGDSSTLTDGAGRYSLAISAAVPEPATWLLALGGVLAMAGFARPGAGLRRKRPA